MPSPGDIQASAPRMRGMFTRIAGMYDRLNRAQSLGLDVVWRKRALACLARTSPSPRRILDLATGTADFAIACARRFPDAHVTGVDLTPAMLEVGRRKVEAAGLSGRIVLEEGDACALACAKGSFDAVLCAFGFRNFPDRAASRACSQAGRGRTTPTCARRLARRVRRRRLGSWRLRPVSRRCKDFFSFLPVHVSYSAEM